MRIVRFIKALVRYIFMGKDVSDEVYFMRLDICDDCEDLCKNDMCCICKCNVKIKARWSTEKCPLNKW